MKERKMTRKSKSHKRGSESYSKGHLFEEVVEEYFKNLGYKVERNVIKTGYSGAKHEIDLLISKGDTIGVVEAKNYSKPIPKEWIIKTYHVAKDIGASEVYVVSAKGFTEDAKKTADILNVKLLDLNEMAEIVRRIKEKSGIAGISTQYLKPAYGTRKALEFADKFAIRKLFSKTEEPTEAELFYVPIYYVKAIYTYVEEEGFIFTREVERHREVNFAISALNNGLLLYDEDGISTISIPPLTDSEIDLIKIMWDFEDARFNELIEETGWNRTKLSRTLKGLIEKGLIEESEDDEGRKLYNLTLPSVEELEENSEALIGSSKPYNGVPNNTLEARVSFNHVKNLLENLYDLEVTDVKMIYVPVYKVKMEKTDESAYRFIYLAGWIDEPVNAEELIDEK